MSEKIFDKSKYDMDYAKKNIRRIAFNLNREHDCELLEWLESKPNMQSTIKNALNEMMKREQKK